MSERREKLDGRPAIGIVGVVVVAVVFVVAVEGEMMVVMPSNVFRFVVKVVVVVVVVVVIVEVVEVVEVVEPTPPPVVAAVVEELTEPLVESKRITLDVPLDLYSAMKMTVFRRGITLRKYVLEVVAKDLGK